MTNLFRDEITLNRGEPSIYVCRGKKGDIYFDINLLYHNV